MFLILFKEKKYWFTPKLIKQQTPNLFKQTWWTMELESSKNKSIQQVNSKKNKMHKTKTGIEFFRLCIIWTSANIKAIYKSNNIEGRIWELELEIFWDGKLHFSFNPLKTKINNSQWLSEKCCIYWFNMCYYVAWLLRRF